MEEIKSNLEENGYVETFSIDVYILMIVMLKIKG